MQERGAEVERLMSLAGTPLLIDMSASSANASGCASGYTATKGTGTDDRSRLSGDRKKSADGLDKPAEAGANGTKQKPAQGDAAPSAPGTRCPDFAPIDARPEQGGLSSGGNAGENNEAVEGVAGSKQPGEGQREKRSSITEADTNNSATKTPEGLDAKRIAATASTPLLPCFSLGSARLDLRGRNGGGSSTAKAENCVFEPRRVGLKLSASAGDLAPTTDSSLVGRGQPRPWPGESTDVPLGSALGAADGRSGPRNTQGCGERREAGSGSTEAAAAKAAVVAAREQAGALLASHLTPFPTITKNRSLHAVSQPIVRHSEGFADACRGDSSRLGTVAWRASREARYNTLVAPADRLSIVRQIEAGFDVLQSRRMSPVA